MSREWRYLLEDIIITACRKVEHYVSGLSLAEFRLEEKTHDAVLWNLGIIGEAAKQLPASIRSRVAGVDWRKVAGFRDVIVHAYHGIDDDIVWDVVGSKVPELSARVRTFLDENPVGES